jgi:hypothetical protein
MFEKMITDVRTTLFTWAMITILRNCSKNLRIKNVEDVQMKWPMRAA